MNSRPTSLAFAVAALMGWVLLLGVLVDRAELFIAAVPLAIGLLSGGSRTQPPRFTLRQEISTNRLAEGDRVLVTMAVSAIDPVPITEVLVAIPAILVSTAELVKALKHYRDAGPPPPVLALFLFGMTISPLVVFFFGILRNA